MTKTSLRIRQTTLVTLVLLTFIQVIVQADTSITNDISQVRVSPTPIRVELPTQGVIATDIQVATVTPSFTPTPEPRNRILVPSNSSDINVRAEPDPNAQRLGSISADETYPVTGRYFSWLQIEYNSSPTGSAWVFDQLVEIIGDPFAIPDVNPFAVPTASNAELSITATQEALLLTPGVELTLTADTRIVVVETPDGTNPINPNNLPTFTPPPDNINQIQNEQVESTPIATPDAVTDAIVTLTQDGLPPIVPIILLGGFGILGLLIALIRGN